MKKGFTLIELLAVIIILAIVALIATPIILNVIEDARISAGRSESRMIYDSINKYCSTAEMKNELDGSINICADGVTIEEVQDMINLGNAIVNKVTYSDGKITELEIESNNHTFILCANGSFVMDDESCNISQPDEPEIPDSISFAEDSWETISEIVKAGEAENFYSIGEEKEVEINNYGTFTLRIANLTTLEECSTEGFSQTACGFVLEFVDLITRRRMNSSNTTVGGWPASSMYTFLQEDIYNSLPNDLQNVIIETFVVSGYGSSDSSNFTSNDKLYLLSPKELWGDGVGKDTALEETRQLDYYADNGVTVSNYSLVKKDSVWWLRTALTTGNRFFWIVGSDGGPNSVSSSTAPNYGVAPAFRIG